MKNKKLVAFFSCSGRTSMLAKTLARAAEADVYEILPEQSYTQEDIDWTNRSSRCMRENSDPNSRPKIADASLDISEYDVIYVGFPIWCYTAPKIILTFLEEHDFAGKTIVPFATSGGSEMGQTVSDLKKVCPNAIWKDGDRLPARSTKEDLQTWIKGL